MASLRAALIEASSELLIEVSSELRWKAMKL